jgi:hypothetical protein
MEPQIPQGPFCQSCGMPMVKPEDFGTNADGSTTREYCHFCFQKGKFTEQNLTMEQMIEKVAGIMAQLHTMPQAQATGMAKTFIPTLKRWQGT